MIKQLSSSTFFRDFLKVFSGTGIAQLLTVATTLLLAKIFSPESIGAAAIITTAITTLGSFASLRYNQAILIPKHDQECAGLARLSIWVAFLVSGLTLLFLIPFHSKILSFTTTQISFFSLFCLPVGVLIVAWFNVFSSLSSRTRQFGKFAKARVLQSLVKAFIILGIGYYISPTQEIIIIGTVISLAAAALFLIWQFRNSDFSMKSIFQPQPAQSKSLAKSYKKFPIFSAPSMILNDLESTAPLYLFGIYYQSSEVGQFAFALSAIRLGTSMLGDSLRRVFFQKTAELINKKLPLLGFYLKFLALTIVVLGIIYTILFFFSESIFLLIFGEKWREAGQIVALLSPLMFLTALIEPIHTILLTRQKQGAIFTIKLLSNLFFFIGMLSYINSHSLKETLVVFCFIAGFFKLILLLRASFEVLQYNRELLND